MNSSSFLILLTLIFTGLSSVIAIRFWWLNRKRPHGLLPRKPIITGNQILAQQILLASILMVFTYFGGFGFEDLGASKTIPPILAFIAGLAVYFLVLGIIEIAAMALGVRDRLHDLSFETMRMIWPRNRRQKIIAFIGVCFMNPFVEEVVYRGALVHFFGNYIGSFIAAGIIGFVFSLAAHLYQGAWSIPFQAMFHGAAILLILSPLGLFACFGLHFAGDLVPVVTMRTNMKSWRDRRRRRKERLIIPVFL